MMNKINKYLNNNIKYIFIIFLLSQPFLDVFTSICINYLHINFTIGMVARFIFIIFSIYYIIFARGKKLNDRYSVYLYLLILFGAIFSIYYLNINTNYGIYEIKNYLRVFYFSFILIFILSIRQCFKKEDLKYFSILFIIYLGFVFVPNFFKGLPSYDYVKHGLKGLFNSANEIGAILSFLFPIFLYNTLKSKNKIIYSIIILIYIYTILSIGTKVPVFAFALTMLIYLLYFYFHIFKNNRKGLLISGISSLLLIVLSCIFILPQTPFYKNIKIHMDYFHINSVAEVFTDINNLDNVVFSQRLTFLKNNYELYESNEWPTKIIGIGYYDFDATSIFERKIVEIDLFDILFSYGLLGFSLYLLPIIAIIKEYLKRVKKAKDFKPVMIISLSLIILISFFAGHVFTAPAVSIYVALLQIIPLKEKKYDKD